MNMYSFVARSAVSQVDQAGDGFQASFAILWNNAIKGLYVAKNSGHVIETLWEELRGPVSYLKLVCVSAHLAYSTARASRITTILIWPG